MPRSERPYIPYLDGREDAIAAVEALLAETDRRLESARADTQPGLSMAELGLIIRRGVLREAIDAAYNRKPAWPSDPDRPGAIPLSDLLGEQP